MPHTDWFISGWESHFGCSGKSFCPLANSSCPLVKLLYNQIFKET